MASRIRDCSIDPKINQERFRYLNKDESGSERNLYHLYWDEMVNLYGTKVEVYIYNYDTSEQGHNSIYGEHTTARFAEPITINMLVNIPTESLMLSKFGYDMNSDFVGIVTVADWRSTFGSAMSAEPKSGDVVRLVEAGWREDDAPDTVQTVLSAICDNETPGNNGTFTPPEDTDYSWIRCPWIFEITERDHQDFSGSNNMLMGHYIWVLKGKRFDYSYQPGIKPECHMDVVGDETFTGIMSGGSQPVSPEKLYPGNANDKGRQVWDYEDVDKRKNRNTDIYGGY